MGWVEEIKKKGAELVLIVEKLDREADAETIRFRTMQCDICPNRVNDKCGICKCYIELKVATKVNRNKYGKKEITHCPIGRWRDEEVQLYYSSLN
jgi:hypothetical protein